MSSPLLSREPDLGKNDYWDQTRRPLACLVFLLPLLALYEWGVLHYGGPHGDSLRNGADYWMRNWLVELGLTHWLLLPLLVAGALLAWHLKARHPWRVSPETVTGMFAESVIFALALLFLGQLQESAFERITEPATLAVQGRAMYSQAIAFVGAGVYEEFLFRLCLLPACYGALRFAFFGPRSALIGAVLATSLLFAGAHYIGEGADVLSPFSFAFRTLAGVFFACLFVVRGFGITVGAHAAYDLFVGFLLVA